MNKVKYGILHNHSEFSVRDASMTIKELFERAKELEAPAVALTDHGILVGILDFMKAGKEYGIKPIPGMEAYYTPDGDKVAEESKAQHLILMAKDLQGYKAICRAVQKSYDYIINNKPCMDMKILYECFGPGSTGYNHVIATSACVFGVLSSILLEDEKITYEIEKIRRKQAKYHPIDSEFLDAMHEKDVLEKELNDLIQQRDSLTEISKINLTGIKKRLKTLNEGDVEYQEVLKILEKETKRKTDAAEALTEAKRSVADKKKELSNYKKSIAKLTESVDKWQYLEEQIESISQDTQDENVIKEKAIEAAVEFVNIFGEGNFYIELQYHHVQNEAKVAPILVDIAKTLNIPVVAANDAHYPTNSRDDVRARSLIAAMRFNQEVVEDDEGYGELYIKSDEELVDTLSEVIPREIAEEALANIGKIVDACNVEFTTGNHYPVFPQENGETASERLRRLAYEGIPRRYPNTWNKEYEDRLNYELNIIDSMGYSDYLCIVQDFLDYGRNLGKQCPEKIGYTIGPGRGSAVGSIVCYLSGITSVDPMRYNLIFERFLNPERVSMPDIDSDLAAEVRERVIAYVQEKYRSKDKPENVSPICSIITKGTMAARAAIKNVARVTNIPLSISEELANCVPEQPHATIDDIPDLETKCQENPVIASLIADAKLVEGRMSSYGIHAAGIIIADNGDVGEYVPLYRNVEKNKAIGPWAAQLDMVQCESEAGLLKMDFLGLKNLDIITQTLRSIKTNYGISIDVENLPEEPEIFKNIFCTGNTDSVFQFESDGMKKMLKQFKPDSMEDIILLVAAYRPGPMQYLDGIVNVKQGLMKPTYIADGLEEILSNTYGYPIFQEQVMQIFNKVADFTMGEADIIRKAMGKKKLAVLTDPKTNYKGKFIEGLIKHGASDEAAEGFWEELLDFASYAFNLSHAAAYGTLSYITAWLKYHYPAEYMSSVLAYTTYKKLPKLVNNCRTMGITMLPPNINESLNSFVAKDNKIIFGFSDIKGVGNSGVNIIKEREEHGNFVSVKNYVTRMVPLGYDKKVTESLIKAGAFDDFCDGNRATLLDSIEDLADKTKKLFDKKESLKERQEVLSELQKNGSSASEIKKAERAVASAEKAVTRWQEAYDSHSFITVKEDLELKLNAEKELLGFYFSGNPLSVYSQSINKIPNRYDIVNLDDMVENTKVTVCGLVKNYEEKQRKSDGQKFCFFTLLDESGEIQAKCFTNAFAMIGEAIKEDAAITVTGKLKRDSFNLQQDDDVKFFLNVEAVKPLQRNEAECSIIISGENPMDFIEWKQKLKEYESPVGYEAFWADELDGRLRSFHYLVSKDILKAEIPGLFIRMRKK